MNGRSTVATTTQPCGAPGPIPDPALRRIDRRADGTNRHDVMQRYHVA